MVQPPGTMCKNNIEIPHRAHLLSKLPILGVNNNNIDSKVILGSQNHADVNA